MRVLLIPPKNNYPDPMPRVDIFGQGFPYIAGALKKAGHEVFGINLNHQWCGLSAPNKLAASIEKAINEYQPDFIGVGGLSGDYAFVRDAIRFTRKAAPHTPVVCGGGIVTYDREYIFNNLHPDFAVSDEAEDTIAPLADCLAGKGDIKTLPNLARWENGQPVFNPCEHSRTRLEDLPLPDYRPFDYGRFLESFHQTDVFYAHTRRHPRIMPISIGRSCPFHCTFCVHSHTAGPRYRQRSIDSAITEIAHFYNEYQFNILFVYDELFAVKKERVIEFCMRIKELKAKSGMDFDWTCDLRVTDVDKSMLAELKDAGCAFIGYGFESASQPVLNSMKKQTKVGQIEQAITLTSQAGIGVQGNFIFGDIAETPETAQETLAFFDQHCRDKMIFLSYIMPYPGSQIYQHCLGNGIISDRQDYYNRISPWGLLKFNMTSMPDDVFNRIIAHLDEVMEPAALQLKEAKILSWAKTGQFADTALPAGMRRPLFTIETTCPHCQEPIGYLHPATPAATTLRTFCPRCHKRFAITLPRAMVPRIKKGWKQTILELFPPFLRPVLVKIYAGFRRE